MSKPSPIHPSPSQHTPPPPSASPAPPVYYYIQDIGVNKEGQAVFVSVVSTTGSGPKEGTVSTCSFLLLGRDPETQEFKMMDGSMGPLDKNFAVRMFQKADDLLKFVRNACTDPVSLQNFPEVYKSSDLECLKDSPNSLMCTIDHQPAVHISGDGVPKLSDATNRCTAHRLKPWELHPGPRIDL